MTHVQIYIFLCTSCLHQKKKMSSYLIEFGHHFYIFFPFDVSFPENRICGVMVSVLASNAVDRGFESWSGQTKDYKIDICCFSAKHATLRANEQRLVGSESE